jgi:hypothetical protein
MCNDGLSASAMEAVRDLLIGAAPAVEAPGAAIEATRLHTLHFFNNMSGDGGAKVSAACALHAGCLIDSQFSAARLSTAADRGASVDHTALRICPTAGQLASTTHDHTPPTIPHCHSTRPLASAPPLLRRWRTRCRTARSCATCASRGRVRGARARWRWPRRWRSRRRRRAATL